MARPESFIGQLYPNDDAKSAALYIHWPFCLKKCPYCDFNSHVRNRIDQKNWQEAYRLEIQSFKNLFPNLKPKSIFFGGGTPSLMAAETVATILNTIDQAWGLDQNIEITLEANPSSVEATRFSGYKAAGVNRLSMGVQSLHDDALKFLGRLHSADEALHALKVARDIFDRVSIDLIYARPDYKQNDWQQELDKALGFDLSHLSLYQLTIEEGTAFYHQYQRGQFTLPDEGEAADLYAQTQEQTAKAGLPAYEISNHAKFGEESQHNLCYWQGDPYLGIGPGAHGRAPGPKKLAHENGAIPHHAQYQTQYHAQAHYQIKRPEDWLKAVKTNGIGLQQCEAISLDDRKIEAIMMGLRLTKGINRAYFQHLFDVDILSCVNVNAVDKKFLTVNDNYLSLTKQGIPVINHILDKILI